jgi:hypothetical protein
MITNLPAPPEPEISLTSPTSPRHSSRKLTNRYF